jgi:hypothetical protein
MVTFTVFICVLPYVEVVCVVGGFNIRESGV